MRRFIEIMWMAIAAVSLVEMLIGYKQEGFTGEHFQVFAMVFVASAFMFFFRKRQRKKMEDRKNNPE